MDYTISKTLLGRWILEEYRKVKKGEPFCIFTNAFCYSDDDPRENQKPSLLPYLPFIEELSSKDRVHILYGEEDHIRAAHSFLREWPLSRPFPREEEAKRAVMEETCYGDREHDSQWANPVINEKFGKQLESVEVLDARDIGEEGKDIHFHIGFFNIDIGAKEEIFAMDLKRVQELYEDYDIQKLFVFFENENNKKHLEELFAAVPVGDITILEDITFFEITKKHRLLRKVERIHYGGDLEGEEEEYYRVAFSDYLEDFYEIYHYAELQEESVKLSEDFRIIKGSYRVKQWKKSGDKILPLVNLKDLNDYCLDASQLSHILVTEEQRAYLLHRSAIQKYDILYSLRGTSFKCSIVLEEHPEIILSDNVALLRYKGDPESEEGQGRIAKVISFLQNEKTMAYIEHSKLRRYRFADFYVPKASSSPEESKKIFEMLEVFQKYQRYRKEYQSLQNKEILLPDE